MVPPIPVRLTPDSLQGILEVVAWIVDSAESDPNLTSDKAYIRIIYTYIHTYIHENINSSNKTIYVCIGHHERVGEVEVGVHLREGFDTCVVFAHGQRQTGGYK